MLAAWNFFKPWNGALRGLDENFKDDRGQGVRDWATCIAVLYSAVVKLSYLIPLDKEGNPVPIVKVWRGVQEVRCTLLD